MSIGMISYIILQSVFLFWLSYRLTNPNREKYTSPVGHWQGSVWVEKEPSIVLTLGKYTYVTGQGFKLNK